MQTKATQSVQQKLIDDLMVKFGDTVHADLIEEICQDNDRHGHYRKPVIVETAWTPTLGGKLLLLLEEGRFKAVGDDAPPHPTPAVVPRKVDSVREIESG